MLLDELREVGHKRRELVEKTYQEIKEGSQSSKELFQKLSMVSDHAIDIIQHQKQQFDNEVGKM